MGGGDPFSSFFGGDFGGIVMRINIYLELCLKNISQSYYRPDQSNVYAYF